MTAILSLKNVSYTYRNGAKSQTVLNNISIDFEEGTFYTVVGPSGSGKTTFLSLACGLDQPTEGEIFFEGETLKRIGLTNYRNQHVAIVFQQYNLLPYMTALQNVVTAMEITKSKIINKKAYAIEMLDRVGLTLDQANQRVLTLSGGQQQRVSIARALSCQSKLILADEPTGNLDEHTAQEVVQLFQSLAHEEDACIIMVTHDMQIANISDQIVRLSKGKLVEDNKVLTV
ncbi:ABC transporter ATP-binding protein [Bacillus coahuilensis]|uniref:ABC transporter ATP-binding protein n=1 Tax=Bacillus coahuilensis TaxID=408580 RepID=UPI0001850B7D|nr:ABC transporter ATP-binding protein [Bacillus coahuilensis]